MNAITYSKYGGPEVLTYAEVEKPTPTPDEVLIKIEATGLNAADWRLMRAKPFLVRLMMGFFAPKSNILGADCAGVVEAVGSAVTEFKVGDAVYGELGVGGNGCLAEYVTAQPRLLAPVPEGVSFVEAAAVPMAGLTALQGLRDIGELKAGQHVMIHGASGGVGTFALQIAKHLGAEVTAVCSTRNVEQARQLGADHVINYKQQDFATLPTTYDLIFAANGDRSLNDYLSVLNPNGTFVMAGGSTSQMFQTMLLGGLKARTSGKNIKHFTAHVSKDDLLILNDLLVSGAVKPVIDRCYPLNEGIEAMRYLDGGSAQGKVIVTMS